MKTGKDLQFTNRRDNKNHVCQNVNENQENNDIRQVGRCDSEKDLDNIE